MSETAHVPALTFGVAGSLTLAQQVSVSPPVESSIFIGVVSERLKHPAVLSASLAVLGAGPDDHRHHRLERRTLLPMSQDIVLSDRELEQCFVVGQHVWESHMRRRTR